MFVCVCVCVCVCVFVCVATRPVVSLPSILTLLGDYPPSSFTLPPLFPGPQDLDKDTRRPLVLSAFLLPLFGQTYPGGRNGAEEPVTRFIIKERFVRESWCHHGARM